MIKRLIYSLFFHAIFLLLILGSFFSKDFDESELKEVAIDIAAVSGNSETSLGNKNKGKIPDKKTLTKNIQKTEPKKEPDKANDQKEADKNKNSSKEKKEIIETKAEEASKANIKNPEEKITDNSEKPKVEDKPKTAEDKPEEKLEETKNPVQEQPISTNQATANSDEKSQEGGASNENISDITSLNLSAREKFNIQSQLRLCYNRASEEIGADGKIKITFKAKISLDGYITTNIEAIIDNQRYNSSDVDYKTSIDLAQRAVEICSPIRNLPIDKYEIWKEVILEFGGPK